VLGLILLTLACAIWGLGFAGTRWTLVDYSPVWSHCLRYIFAASLALPILALRKGFKDVKGAFYCSILLMAGLQFQTIGIAHTTMAKSGFLTVFYSVFTPILAVIFLKQRLRKTFWALLSVAMFGMFLMCDLKLDGFNKGDLFVLISALFFSLHILAVDHYAEDVDTINFNFLQCFFMGIQGVALGLLLEGPVSLAPLFKSTALVFPSSLIGFIILSVFSSLIAFSLQIFAQKRTPPHIVGLVFLSESIFASIFGRVFFHETITTQGFMGAIIILIAVALIPRFAQIQKPAH
jgi:drug/metabolite transporter (DMT)-like permease